MSADPTADVTPVDPDPDLIALAQAYAVATEFWDWRGQHVQVAGSTLIAVLAALGVDASTSAARAAALEAQGLDRWRRMLPATVVARQGGETTFWVHVRHGAGVEVWLELEDGSSRGSLTQAENWASPVEVDGRWVGEATFVLPSDLPLGYHTVRVRSEAEESSAAVIVTPAWLGFPERMGNRRAWGFATQLYSVRSRRSWGVGDLDDLGQLACWSAAEHAAGFVLVNPLHAAEPTAPMEPSPYLPSSRRFGNPLYLRVEAVAEYAYADAGTRSRIDALGAGVRARADGLDRIDRDTAWTAKRAALELLFAQPADRGREIAFYAYCAREGVGLRDFATWCVLAEEHGPDWKRWPQELRHPDSPAVEAMRRERSDRIAFHQWLQWQLDEQLDGAQSAARRSGMVLGVMHDLAVGVHGNGADAWALQDVLASGVTVGAPPDAYSQTGQDWNQPPWRPDQLAEQAYAPFRALVSTVLRHAGGVRIDHIIGLFRLWWIPAGAEPTAGTYVRYDHDALIGILALEAARADALVVGEDLGTVEPWVRDYLRERGILGTSILWFEFDYSADGAVPLAAERWRDYCLASVTTHDLPPTAGYLAGDHVRLRHRLGLLTQSLDEELATDRAEQTAWIEELRRRGALSDSEDPSGEGADVEQTVLALHRYLSWTPSRLLALALTDAVGDRRTQNQPGTVDEYPNWRVPLTGPDGQALYLEDVFDSPRAAALAETMRR